MRSSGQENFKFKKMKRKAKEQEECAMEQDHINEGLKELNME